MIIGFLTERPCLIYKVSLHNDGSDNRLFKCTDKFSNKLTGYILLIVMHRYI